MKLMILFIIGKIVSFTFNPGDLKIIPYDSFYKVELEGCLPIDTPFGAPQLPYKNIFYLLQKDEKVDSIKIKNSIYVDIEGEYYVYPVQPPQVISEPPNGFYPPDSLIYSSNNFYPGIFGKYEGESYMGGYRIANFSIFPVQYLPSQKKLRLYTYLEFELYTSYSPYQGVPVYRRSKKVERIWEDIIKKMVYNPEDLGSKRLNIIIEDFKESGKFSPTELPSIYGSSVECLIIVPDTLFLNAIKDFAEFKIKKGCPTVIKTLDWIYENYQGFDEQNKIRNFIKDAYSYWGTLFCVLIGDKELIPVRYLMTKRDIFEGPRASDAYYVGLDGEWNINGDTLFGEWNERDLTPEVFVGRIVVNNLNELYNFLEKYFAYIKPEIPSGDTLYPHRALLFGSTDVNWCVTPCVEEIKSLLTNHGYLVKDFVDWWPNQQNSDLKDSVINEMNKGAIIFHTYHGSADRITIDHFSGGTTDFTVSDILNLLTNTNKYNILYSYGCSAGDWTHQYSLSHIWLTAHQKGGVAWLGSTQVNLYSDAKYMKEFVRWLLSSKHPHLGIIEWASKAQIPAEYYHIHQLSGDPEMEVWTDIPKELIVNYPLQIPVGTQSFQVIVWESGTFEPVESALVCVYKEDEVYVYDYTNENGIVNFQITPETPGNIYITVTKHNYFPSENAGIVTGAGYAYIRYKAHKIDDDVYGQSNGNSNGVPEANEIIELRITLENTGGFPSTNTYARLRIDDRYIEVIDGESFYGTIPPGSSLEGEPFLIKILDMPSDSDRHYALLMLSITHDGLINYDNFPIYLYVPDLKHTSHDIEKRGTTYYLYPEVTNYNYGDAREVFAYLSTENPNVIITDSEVYFGDIKARERKYAPQDIFVNRFEFITSSPLDTITFKIKYVDYYNKI